MTTTAVTTREITTHVFNNHLPLRTKQEEVSLFLDYDYLDFGGHYFCYCRCSKSDGSYHCWLEHNTAYCDDSNYMEYLGLFADYDQLVDLISGLNYTQQGEIIRSLVGVIDLPEC